MNALILRQSRKFSHRVQQARPTVHTIATRWFSGDNGEDNSNKDKDKDNKMEDLLDDDDFDDLAAWLGHEALPSEMPEMADFFKGEAAERYTQFANESYADTYESVYKVGPESEDYVPFDEWVMAKEASTKILGNVDAENELRRRLKSKVPPKGAKGDGPTLDDEEDVEQKRDTFVFRARDPRMNDSERGIVESHAKFRKAKAKKIAYDKWKEHLYGFQMQQYTEADQLVMHQAPALTNDHAIGVRPIPIWEVLRQHQQYPEDDQGDDEDEDRSSLFGLAPSEMKSLSPTMAERVQAVDDQFDNYSNTMDFVDEEESKSMGLEALLQELSAPDHDLDADDQNDAPFFKIQDTPDTSDSGMSQELERSLSGGTASEKDSIEVLLSRAGFVMHHIYSDRVSNMTAKGKVHSIRALVVLGNQHGTAGFATSRADFEDVALDLACKKAVKNLMYLDLYKGHSLHEPLRGRCHSTHALLWPGHPNGGLRVGRTMWAVCDCFGIQNMSGKVIGRNNPHAVIPAIFSALLKYRPLEDVALGRGRRLFDIRDAAPRYMMGF